MNAMLKAARAYQASSDVRSVRAREADVFRRANGALRDAAASREGGDRIRAIADNRRLWLTVVGLLQDPHNELVDTLRANLISIGHSVQREMDSPAPDLEFLITINENVADGLAAGA